MSETFMNELKDLETKLEAKSDEVERLKSEVEQANNNTKNLA